MNRTTIVYSRNVFVMFNSHTLFFALSGATNKSNQVTAVSVDCIINQHKYQIRGTCDVDVHFRDVAQLYGSVLVVEVNISICILSICLSAKMHYLMMVLGNCFVPC